MRRIVAAALVVFLAGCGLTMTRGPDPRRPADQRPDCTESFSAPLRDSIGAIAGLLAILTGVVFAKYSDSNDDVGPPLIVGGVVVAGASYASGAVGYYRVKKCRAAIKEFERRHPPAVSP